MRGSRKSGGLWAGAVVVATLSITPQFAADQSPQDRFSAALAAAKANLATPEGHAFDQALAAYLRPESAAVLGGCFKASPAPDRSPFELVFRLAKSGAVLDAMAWPETNTGLCLAEGLKAKTFPAPPREGYWAELRMSFGR